MLDNKPLPGISVDECLTMALDCRRTGNKAVLRRSQTCRDFEGRTREQTDNMILLTKGPVL